MEVDVGWGCWQTAQPTTATSLDVIPYVTRKWLTVKTGQWPGSKLMPYFYRAPEALNVIASIASAGNEIVTTVPRFDTRFPSSLQNFLKAWKAPSIGHSSGLWHCRTPEIVISYKIEATESVTNGCIDRVVSTRKAL